MSEGSAEGGSAPLSEGQFGDVTDTGETALNPGDGIFTAGWYPWNTAQRGAQRPRGRKKRKRTR